MALIDKQMRKLVEEQELGEIDPAHIRASSIDLRLDSFARRVKPGAMIDLLSPSDELKECFEDIAIHPEGYVLPPGASLVGQTKEMLQVPETAQGRILQRSSLVRLGIQVTSSVLNPGYQGHLPILIINASGAPVRLYADFLICQLTLTPLAERPAQTYAEQPGAKYQGERPFRHSRIFEDRVRARFDAQIGKIADDIVTEAKKRGLI